MYQLKLIKALSCTIGTVRATKKTPYCMVEDKELADKAVDLGYFTLIDEVPFSIPEEKIHLTKMTMEECKAFAKEYEIDVSDCRKKADYIKVISVALGGSATMIELQND